jgi:exodeoxyribonuclease VII large subunit
MSSTKVLIDQDQSDLFGENFLDLELKAKVLAQRIDWIKTQKKVEYINDLINLQNHTSKDVRRRSATTLCEVGNSEVLNEVKTWQEKESDKETWLILETLIDKIERGVLDNKELDAKVFSVTEIIKLIKTQIGEKTYTIEGELAEIKPIHNMYYFGLKDAEDTRINCSLFLSDFTRLGFAFNDGLAVRVTGKFKLRKDGRINFEVSSIKLTGEGELLRNLKLLEQKLTLEGFFDPLRKRKLNRYPAKVLLIASPSSAAYSDFIKIINNRRKALKIYLLPIKTQGVNAEFDILQALQTARDEIVSKNIDTAIITRGGGSSDDLSVFNSEKVVRAIHALPCPLIAAIGHERDVTLTELASDLRASTPSNAAELVSTSQDEIENEVINRIAISTGEFDRRCYQYRHVASQLINITSEKIRNKLVVCKEVTSRVDRLIQNYLSKYRFEANVLYQESVTIYKTRILDNKKILNKTQYLANIVSKNVYQTRYNLQNINNLIESYDLNKILSKGFTMAIKDDKLITKKSQLQPNQNLILKFFDGDQQIRTLENS